MSEVAVVAKKRGRPPVKKESAKKEVARPVEPVLASGNGGSYYDHEKERYEQDVLRVGMDLLKIILTARSGKPTPDATKQAYKMAKDLVDFSRFGLPEVENPEFSGKNLSAANMAALDWDLPEA